MTIIKDDGRRGLTPEDILALAELMQVQQAIRTHNLAKPIAGPKGDEGDRGDEGKRGHDGRDGKDGRDGRDPNLVWNSTALAINGGVPVDLRGDQGDKGEQGERGFIGNQGLQGIQGETGETGERGEAGEQGIQGLPGQDGRGIKSMSYDKNTDILSVTYDDGATEELVKGLTLISRPIFGIGSSGGSSRPAPNPSNYISVAGKNGDFTSIKEAVDSITDATSSNRYTIQVYPGIYQEDNPIQGKPYINVSAVGSLGTVVVSATNADADMFISADSFTLDGLNINNVSGVDKYAIRHDVSGAASADNMAFFNCSNGLLLDNAFGAYSAHSIALVAVSGTITNAIVNKAGSLNVQDIGVAGPSTIETILTTDGADALTTIDIFNSFSPNVGTCILFDNESRSIVRNVSFVEADNGVIAQNGANARVDNGGIFLCDTGVSIPDTGSNTTLGLGTVDINNNAVLNINVKSQTANITGLWTGSLTSTEIAKDANAFFLNVDLTDGDQGVSVVGELHVGRPERPTESTFGGGDSYTRGMLVYTYNPTGTVYTDVTAIAASSESSTFSLPNTITDTAIYMCTTLGNGTPLEHPGIKYNAPTAVTLGGGSFVYEYWNGATWTEFPFMVTQSSGKYFPYAKAIFENAGSHQVRYNLRIDDWVANDDPGIGTNYYWSRVRVDTAITTSMTIEQIKIHSNRAEFNDDGFLEFFGTGRPFARFPWDAGLLEAGASSPGNQDLFLSDNLDVGRVENLFLNNATDRIGFLSPLPEVLDTSTPVIFAWSVITDSADTDTIDWVIRWGWNLPDGNVYSSEGAAPTTAPNEQSISQSIAAPGATNKVQWNSVNLDISDALSRREGGYPDTLWVTLQRTNGDAHDGDVALVAIAADYAQWSFGGHI